MDVQCYHHYLLKYNMANGMHSHIQYVLNYGNETNHTINTSVYAHSANDSIPFSRIPISRVPFSRVV